MGNREMTDAEVVAALERIAQAADAEAVLNPTDVDIETMRKLAADPLTDAEVEAALAHEKAVMARLIKALQAPAS